MPIYTPNDFKTTLQTDVWVLQQMLHIPNDPPTEITSEYDPATGITNTHVKFVVSISMPAMQEAVKEYQKSLTPIFFIVAQKVYAELFRVFLGNNNISAKWKQKDIQDAIMDNFINKNALAQATFNPAFHDVSDFNDWWLEKYDYDKLRNARNQVVHNEYSFANDILTVEYPKGVVLINWNTNKVLSFVQDVIGKAQAI